MLQNYTVISLVSLLAEEKRVCELNIFCIDTFVVWTVLLTVSKSSDISSVCARGSVRSPPRVISYCEQSSFIWRQL